MPNLRTRLVNALGIPFVDLGDAPSATYGHEGTRIPLADNDPMRTTYGIFLPSFIPAGANPTSFLEMVGAANVITRIRQIILAGEATAATNLAFALTRRASALTGSTPVAQTVVVRDSNDPVASTIVRTMTVTNPSGGGASPAQIDGQRLNLAPAANGSIDRALFQYGWQNDKAPVLRGGEFMTLDLLNGAAWPAGGKLDIAILFSEEAA